MSDDLAARLRRWRHDLHKVPELGMQEFHTSDYLTDQLESMGLAVARNIGGTGLVATITGGATDRPGGAIALRADMDGLPLAERNDLPYRSRHDGVMHACGHDGHMAMLLGAAHALAEDREFSGTVHLVFQPAEEHGLGARAMVDDGLFDRFPVAAMFGLHNLPGQSAGHLATRVGAIMASEDNFEIRITGRGGHSARPDVVADPIVVAAQVVLGLQTIVARNLTPTETAVVSCTEVTTDGTRNAIPGTVVIRGDARSFTPQVRDLLERRVREISTGISTAHDATCDVTWTSEFAATVNDPEATEMAVVAARQAIPADHVDPSVKPWTASEDFGVFLQEVPGCFVLLGNGHADGPGSTPLHSPDYDFNDDVLETGVAWWTSLVRTVLGTGPPG